MLDELVLEKKFVEFLNNKMDGVEEAKLDELLHEYISEFADVSREEIQKELDAIGEELEQILEKKTRAGVLYSALKSLKNEPTLEDFVKLYYLTLGFQLLGRGEVMDALRGKDAEKILKEAGRKDLIGRKLSITMRTNDDGERVLEIELPQETLRTIAETIFEASKRNKLAEAFVDVITPMILFGTGGGGEE